MSSVTNSTTPKVWSMKEMAEDGLDQLKIKGWLIINQEYSGHSFMGSSGTLHKIDDRIVQEIEQIAKERNIAVDVELKEIPNDLYGGVVDYNYFITLKGKLPPWKQ